MLDFIKVRDSFRQFCSVLQVLKLARFIFEIIKIGARKKTCENKVGERYRKTRQIVRG